MTDRAGFLPRTSSGSGRLRNRRVRDCCRRAICGSSVRIGTGCWSDPGSARLTDLHDTFHPGGVMWDGRIVGAWGRRRGHVDLRVSRSTGAAAIARIEAEALSLPIPGVTMSATIHRC